MEKGAPGMAQLRLTVRELEELVKVVKPAVEVWAANRAEEYAIWLGKRRKAIAEADVPMTQEEIGHEAERRRSAAAAKQSWWHIFPPRLEKFINEVTAEDARNRMHARQKVRDEFMFTDPDPDHITPVLNYLEAMVTRLDPEAVILLSDKETFQMKKAMEIADVDDSGIEDSVS
jgi:hypothetical protein